MPVPSKVLPERVRNSSFGSQADMPPGSLRVMTSEKTPCVGCPIRTVLRGRSIRAWGKVSPALKVEPRSARRPARCDGGPGRA
jgi:hypothetical protein